MADKTYNWQVHRFHDAVAISTGSGPTCYLTAEQALALSAALGGAAESVKNESFVDSTFGTARGWCADNSRDLPKESRS